MKSTILRPVAGIGLTAALVALVAAVVLAEHFSEWSAPMNLGSTVNSLSLEVCPSVTRTGLSLYFGSNRPGSLGNADIYVARRESVDAPWGPPQNLGPTINTPFIDNCPFVTPDGHSLIFLSNRPGSLGLDLYVASRRDKRDDFAWQAPVPLAALNSPFDEVPPSAYEDEETEDFILYFASNRPGGPGGFDIYTSRMGEDGMLFPPILVPELSSPAQDLFPTVRKDGRELILSSDRPGTLGGLDLWVARRERPSDVWSIAENLGPMVNSVGVDQRPSLSRNALTLIFSSNRDGNFDLYEMTRSRERSRD
jgi:hypothetical protein